MSTDVRATVEYHCPGCLGMRQSESGDLLPTFDHTTASCSIATGEAATLREDHARLCRRARSTWHRPATPVERALVRAAGVHVDPHAPLFARVDWSTPGQRVRTFARAQRLGAVDEVTP